MIGWTAPAAAKARDEVVDPDLIVDDVDLGAEASHLGVDTALTRIELLARTLEFDKDGACGGSDDHAVGYSSAGR
ncbi:hypothetical protein L3Q67_26560 [Saccharothrix sp. AJ9571]|nr:hypothetical protein L3Q67_26560 [Saccharothrix sp. AJ9571]